MFGLKRAKGEKSKTKNGIVKKRIFVAFTSFLMLFSMVPFQRVRAGAVSAETEEQTMELVLNQDTTKDVCTGLLLDGSKMNYLRDYLNDALLKKFEVTVDGEKHTTDLASAWHYLAMNWAFDGAADKTCAYKWKDFSDADVRSDIRSRLLNNGTEQNNLYDVNKVTGYYGEKTYDKNHFAGTSCKFYNSGLQHATSLNEAVKFIEGNIQTGPGGDYKGGSVKHFMWDGSDESERGTKDQHVFYMDSGYAANSWNFTGNKRKDRYAHTGVFFYNFSFTPYLSALKDDDLTEINTDSKDYKTSDDGQKGIFKKVEDIKSFTTDNTHYPYDTTGKKTFAYKKTLTSSWTTSHSATHSDSNAFKTAFGLTNTSGNSTPFKIFEKAFAGNFSMDYTNTIVDSFTDGWTKGKSTTDAVEDTYNAEQFVPAGYKGVMEPVNGIWERTVKMNCPVCLSFDVAVVTWMKDASDDDAPSQAVEVKDFGTDEGLHPENAIQSMLKHIGEQGWMSDYLNLREGNDFGSINSKSTMTSMASATAHFIPCTKEGMTVTLGTPDFIVTHLLYDKYGNLVDNIDGVNSKATKLLSETARSHTFQNKYLVQSGGLRSKPY